VIRSFFLVVCLAAVPGVALAQSPLASDTWLLTPSIGFAFDPDADVTLTASVAAAYPVTPNVAVEGELGHLFDMASDDADVDSSLTTVHAALLYFFDTDYVLAPYLAAGLGVGHFSHEVIFPPVSIDSNEIGFNLGGGVTYPIADAAWFRGDFRFFKHIDDVPSAWRFSVGVTLRLGN
jgi:hypothetical protein